MAFTHHLYRSRLSAVVLLLVALCALLVLPSAAVPQVVLAQSSISINTDSFFTRGTINSGAAIRYVLLAEVANQGKRVTIEASSTGRFQVTLMGADGQFLGSTEANMPLAVQLPSTQDYYLTLQSQPGARPANYTLRVTVASALMPQPPTPMPLQVQRIQFAPGNDSVTVNGYVDSLRPMVYWLPALADQLTVTVQLDGGGPYLATITDANGAPLGWVGANGTTTVHWPSTRRPSIPEYYITINTPAGACGSGFRLTVAVAGSTPPRIAKLHTFYGRTPDRYTVPKNKGGENMVVELFTDAGAPAQAIVKNASGETLGFAIQNCAFSGQLPSTQSYSITVDSLTGTFDANYTLRVSIY